MDSLRILVVVQLAVALVRMQTVPTGPPRRQAARFTSQTCHIGQLKTITDYIKPDLKGRNPRRYEINLNASFDTVPVIVNIFCNMTCNTKKSRTTITRNVQGLIEKACNSTKLCPELNCTSVIKKKYNRLLWKLTNQLLDL